MKSKITYIAILFTLMSSISVHAQTDKGKFLVGADGNIDFSTGNENNVGFLGNGEVTTSAFLFNPMGGYFVADNFLVGLCVPVNISTSKSVNSNDRTDQNSYGINLFSRYYFLEDALKPYAFVQGGIGTGELTVEQTDIVLGNKYSSYNIGAGLGLAYFFNDKVALELNLGYEKESRSFKDAGEGDSEDINRFRTKVGFIILL